MVVSEVITGRTPATAANLYRRHLMTGIGAYFFIAWGTWLRHCLNGKQDQYELRWPRLITSLPVIVRKYPARGSSLANGTSKKEL